jgi:tRNA pseudouridine55 synthase
MPRFGVLNLNKPVGLTSRQVVDRVERLARPQKAGHAGTLDPLASGVLIVALGQATRLIEYVQRLPKRYRATFLLGRSSPTDDIEGEVTLLEAAHVPTPEAIEQAVKRFVGRIWQRPPAYSAIHVRGQRSYRLARQGQAVELEARAVEVHSIAIVAYRFPALVLDVECGAGTYMRSLGRDLGESLGTAAVMSALERTAIGPFCVRDACTLEQLVADGVDRHLIEAAWAIPMLSRLILSDDETGRVLQGQAIRRPTSAGESEFAAVDSLGRLVAILKRRGDGSLGPRATFGKSLRAS